MDRESYIRELRLALQGQISQENVNEHLRYYENYIIEESRKGRTEAQVIEDLGNPRLIAKTIIDTTDKIYTEQSSEGREEKSRKFKLFQYGKRVAFLVFLVLMLLLIAHVAIVLIPVFLPVLLIACVIYFLFFSNRK